jgi:hypothetical protein
MPAATEEPQPTALTEKVEKRLVQLDVAVEGDPDAIRAITAKDFALYVGEHEIQGLIVDRLCGDEPAPPPSEGALPVPTAAPKRPRATFVFFFDQPHLTMAGRVLSLDLARELITRLIVDGNRASIVSNGKRLITVVPMTDDPKALIEGLGRVRRDLRNWDSYAITEDSRRGDVLLAAIPGVCPPLARTYAREEWSEARRGTVRLATTLSSLTEVAAPKGLIYFGDTLRQKAGLHYLQIFPAECAREISSATMVPSAAAEFDALTAEATARNVHFFTVQAEGMSSSTTQRERQAQDALIGLAAETGGEAYLGGASNEYIGRRIEGRASCALLISFPAGDLPRDKAMNVTLTLNARNVKIRTQGRIMVPSAEAIERARLLAAFVDPGASDDGSLRALIIPRSGDGKTWKVSVQLRLRPTGLPDNSAELGASIVRRDTVTDHFAASIATKSGSRSMVLERNVDIAPGEFSIVAVARDANRGDIGSSRLDASWPDPAKSEAVIAPIALIQTGPAAISKEGTGSSSGALARDVDEMLDPSIGVSLTTVVCRGARTKNPVIVERWFDGGSRDQFTPMTIAETAEPCVQTVDAIPAGKLLPGVVDYHVIARVGDEIVAQERRTLRVGSQAIGP